MKKQHVIIFIVVLLVSSYLSMMQSEASAHAREKSGPFEGQIAPNFHLETLEGTAFSLKDFRGKKVIVTFFATWCGVCQEEMPHLVAFSKNNRSDQFALIGIHLTSEDNNLQQLADFLAHYEVPFPVGLDKNGEVQENYYTRGIPMTLLIDEEGVVEKRIMGLVTEQQLQEYVLL